MSGHLTIDGLSKAYDDDGTDILAVNDLDIDVEPGELLILVGPSGCGKSTTLRCIAGLENVTEGEIRIDGEEVTDEPSTKRDIAMVFQDYALYPHMTARQNMSFGLKMSTDLSKKERDRKVDAVARTMGIEELLEKHPGELSGGQQQRVALGRAIVRDPSVFLMDEPLSNLDAKLRTKMRTEILSLQEELGVTTIYVTHNQTEAMTMGDRIAILNDGELQQLGTPLECYHRPTNSFVASFIGSPSMNFIDVTYDPEDGRLSSGTFEYVLSEDGVSALEDDEKKFTFGIRPEDIELVSSHEEADMTVQTDVVEPRGDVTYFSTSSDGTSITVTVEGSAIVDSEDRLGLKFPEPSIYLFDAASGELAFTRKRPESESVTRIDTDDERTQPSID